MEEARLRSHLIRIYAVTSASVLFVVVFAIAALFYRDAAARNRENFSTLLSAVSDQLRTEDLISHSQLRRLEQSNRMLLWLLDNGVDVLYNNGAEGMKELISATESLAGGDGYDIFQVPLTSQRRTSPIYSFSMKGNAYLGAVSILPLQRGYRAVVMVQRVSLLRAGEIALLLAGYLVSLLLLSLVGVRLIDRALLPAVESRRRQTRFIAAASHELRSPLAVIAANAATLAEGPQDARDAAAAIEKECGRMSRLIGDMLLLASTDAGDWPVSLAPLEMDTLLINAYESYAPVFAQNGCTLRLLLPQEPLPHVMADGERLSQVLGILLDNALSHGMGGELKAAELTAHAGSQGVAVTVTDHGTGLTREQRERAFERFYRGDASRRDKQHFGLGLSIAFELIRLQNGSLTIEDTPGGGCTFRITL